MTVEWMNIEWFRFLTEHGYWLFAGWWVIWALVAIFIAVKAKQWVGLGILFIPLVLTLFTLFLAVPLQEGEQGWSQEEEYSFYGNFRLLVTWATVVGVPSIIALTALGLLPSNQTKEAQAE